MAFDPFQNLPATVDLDKPVFPEDKAALPWARNPEHSWVDYRCWTEWQLDSGMALHKPLPQKKTSVDTLASVFFTDMAPETGYASSQKGVNLDSKGGGSDVIQRMATSTYRLAIKGWGVRVGYKVPPPGVRAANGSTLTPARQWTSANQLIGSLFGGVPVWMCAWDLNYIMTRSPQGDGEPVPPNVVCVIRGDAELPAAILVPRRTIDSNAVSQPPQAQVLQFLGRVK